MYISLFYVLPVCIFVCFMYSLCVYLFVLCSPCVYICLFHVLPVCIFVCFMFPVCVYLFVSCSPCVYICLFHIPRLYIYLFHIPPVYIFVSGSPYLGAGRLITTMAIICLPLCLLQSTSSLHKNRLCHLDSTFIHRLAAQQPSSMFINLLIHINLCSFTSPKNAYPC